MSKILLVSGCSYSDEKWTSVHHPELDVSWPKWPQLLADKLDMKLINLSVSGAGQEYIYSNIIDKLQTIEHSQIGLVVAAWSTAPRRDYQVERILSQQKNIKTFQWTNEMFDSKGFMNYWIDRSLRYYYSLQTICEYLKIPFKQFQMVDLFKGYLWQELISKRTNEVPSHKQIPILNGPKDLTDDEKYWKEKKEKNYLAQIHDSPYYKKINDNFIGWPTDPRLNGYSIGEKVLDNTTDRISKIDLHPNKQGQEKIAEFLYDRLG